MYVEFEGNQIYAEVDQINGRLNFFDDDCFLSLAFTGEPTQDIVNAIVRAYYVGQESGKSLGALQARREIRVALGIESNDL